MLRRSPTAAPTLPLLATLCLLFLVGFSSARADVHHKKRDFKHEVEGMEEQWRQAQIAGDVAAMDRLLSDDYVGISMNGQVNDKAQQLDRLRNRSVAVSKIVLSDLKVKLVGPVAIVTSTASVEGTNDGASVTGVYRYTRVYQRLPTGTWKITNFEMTRVPQGPRRLHRDPNDAPPSPTP